MNGILSEPKHDLRESGAAGQAYATMAASLGQDGTRIVANRTRYIEAAENLALRSHFCRSDHALAPRIAQ